MNTYIWCEDSQSGYMFWIEIFNFSNSKYIVESKKSVSGLYKAVNRISDDENNYYILVDNAVDNPDVLREIKRIYSVAKTKGNIHIIKINSFEFTLLSFSLLEKWVFAFEDDLKEKRKNILIAREMFVKTMTDIGTNQDLAAFKNTFGFSESITSEQISAKLLYDITRNTGFETDKGHLGACFIKNCCNFEERQEDDICGLDDNRLSADEKFKQLIELSVLKNALQEVGLYDNSI